MTESNLNRFKSDLKKLIDLGHRLQIAMIVSTLKDKNSDELLKNAGLGDKQIEDAKKDAGKFGMQYQSWYSQSVSLISQVFPHRLSDFRAQYDIPKGRKAVDHSTYVMSDFLIGLRTSRGGDTIADASSAIPKYQIQYSILLAVNDRFDSSLYDIKQLLQADLFDSELASAQELLKNKFTRAAGAIAGVVIERHLQQVCTDHAAYPKKKNPSISDLNEALKSSGVIDIPQWRHITLMGDYRNLCDHKKDTEPTFEQVSDLLSGADKIIKTIA